MPQQQQPNAAHQAPSYNPQHAPNVQPHFNAVPPYGQQGNQQQPHNNAQPNVQFNAQNFAQHNAQQRPQHPNLHHPLSNTRQQPPHLNHHDALSNRYVGHQNIQQPHTQPFSDANNQESKNQSASHYFKQRLAAHSQQAQQAVQASEVQSTEARSQLESILVKFILPIVFVMVLMIGILMLFISGIDWNFITEPVRIALGVILAIALYGLGIRLHKKQKPALGKALLGGAHGIFIITITVGHLSYHLYGMVLTLLLYVIANALIILSAWKWKSQILVSLAVASGYLCAFLLNITPSYIIVFISFQLLFSICMMLLSKALNFEISSVLSYVLLHISLLASYNLYDEVNGSLIIAALLVQSFSVYYLYTNHTKQQRIQDHAFQLTSFILTILWGTFLFYEAEIKEWMYRIVPAVYFLLYIVSVIKLQLELNRNSSADTDQIRTKVSISALITTGALFVACMQQWNEAPLFLALLLSCLALVLFAIHYRYHVLLQIGIWVGHVLVLIILVNLPNKLFSLEVLSWGIVLLSYFIIYKVCQYQLQKEQHNLAIKNYALPYLLWSMAVIAFIVTTLLANLVATQYVDIDYRQYCISLAWLIYSLCAIAIGLKLNIKKSRIVGIFILLLIAIKVIFIDINFLDLFIKSLLFVGLGIIGILVSYILYNKQK